MFFAEAAQITAVAGELLDAAAGRRDPEAVVGVTTDADGAVHFADALEVATEAARPVFQTSECGQEPAIACELLHPASHGFGRVDVPLPVERDEVGAGGTRANSAVAAKLARLCSVLPPQKFELSAGRKDLDAMVRLVGDINAPIATNRHAPRVVELAGVGAGFPPLSQELSLVVVDGQAIGSDPFLCADVGK